MKKNSIFRLALCSLMLFPLSTLFQDKIEIINKLVFTVVMVLILIYLLYKGTIKKNNISIILWLTFLGDYLWVMLQGLATNINMMFYFPFFFIYTIFVLETYESILMFLKENRRFILGVIRVWTILVAISIPMSSSYIHEWGKGTYFVSYTSSPFRLCQAALFIMILVTWLTANENTKRYLVYDITPLFCMFMGGSRTYLGVGTIVLLINWYLVLKNKRHFYCSLIPLALIFIVILQNTSMQDKINATSYTSASYFDFWGTVTNGRSIFWKSMLTAYLDSNFTTKLFGGGFSFTINAGEHWAHNDYIEILCTYGIVGIGIYLYCMIKLIKDLLSFSNNKIPNMVIILLIMVWCINAFFNMFYTYFCAIASFPFLLLSIVCYYRNKARKNNV